LVSQARRAPFLRQGRFRQLDAACFNKLLEVKFVTPKVHLRFTSEIFQKASRHKEWRLVLDQFTKHLRWYNSPEDIAYWYGERALSGLLAASAWGVKEGGWSLEEFSGLRSAGKGQSAGRGDLWLGAGGRTFTIEAKFLWSGGPVSDAIENTRKKLLEARKQLISLDRDYQIDIPTAVCYVVPNLKIGGDYSDKSSVDQLFFKLQTTLLIERRMIATFRYKSDPPRHEGVIYPGIIMVSEFWPPWARRKPVYICGPNRRKG